MTLEQIVQLVGASPYLMILAGVYLLYQGWRSFLQSDIAADIAKNGFRVNIVHKWDADQSQDWGKRVDKSNQVVASAIEHIGKDVLSVFVPPASPPPGPVNGTSETKRN